MSYVSKLTPYDEEIHKYDYFIHWHDYFSFTIHDFPLLLIRRYEFMNAEKSIYLIQFFGITLFHKQVG